MSFFHIGPNDEFHTVLALSWGQFLTFGKKKLQVIRRVTNPSGLGGDLVRFASDLASFDVAPAITTHIARAQ